MNVTCEGCETRFHVDERLLKPAGSKVRCYKCRHVFVAYPPALPEESEEPLVLSEELKPEATVAGPVGEDAGTGSFDTLFDDAAAAAAPGPAEAEPELLDVDDLAPSEQPTAPGLTPETGAFDLGLDLDLDLKPSGAIGDASAAPPPPAAGPAAAQAADAAPGPEPSAVPDDATDGLPDLDELELDLAEMAASDGDSSPPAAKNDAGKAAGPELELDLDLDLALENQEETARTSISPAGEKTPTAASDGRSLELLNELNLDLASVPEATTTTLAKDAAKKNLLAETDEIDLSDLETMLDGSPSDGSAPPAGHAPAAAELFLEEEGGAGPAGSSEEELDLSFLAETADQPLVSNGETQPTEPAAAEAPGAPAATDELDFSDLSDLLENNHPPAEEARQIDDVELVLDKALPPESAAADSPQELDLEKFLIDDAEDSHATDVGGLDLEPTQRHPPGASTDLEIEFEPVSPAVAKAATAPATTAVGAVSNTVAEAGGAAAGMAGATDVMETEPAEAPPAFKTPQPVAARRSGGLIKALGGLALVLVLALAALVVPRGLGLHIPYLTDTEIPVLSEIDLELPFIGHVGKLFKAEPADPAGRLKIVPDAASVTAEFVENTAAGRLLVVKGKVRNAYDHPRSAIQVSATLFAKGGTPLRTATVYAGNLLTAQQLSALDINAIRSRLQIRTGAADSNVGVKPGRSLSFMAVFDNLPAGIDEYSVEVVGSAP